MKKYLSFIFILAVILCLCNCEVHENIVTIVTEGRTEELKKTERVYFKPDESNFENENRARTIIKDIADEYNRFLKEANNSGTFSIHIIGYAAIINNGMDPNWLSYKRAQKVSDILLNEHNLNSHISIFVPFKYEGIPLKPFYEPEHINLDEEKPYEWRGETDIFSRTELEPNRVVVIEINKTVVTPGSGESSVTYTRTVKWCLIFIILFIAGAIIFIIGLILGLYLILSLPGYIVMLVSALLSYFICQNNVLLIILGALTLVGIIALILRNAGFSGGGGSGGGGGKRSGGVPKDITISKSDDENQNFKPYNYKGGYYGEIHEEPGKTTAHHIPSNMAINKAFGFTGINEEGGKEGMVNGWTPAVEMDYEDHEFTTSYKYSSEGREFQQKQVSLMQEGKMAEALKMDIDDVLRIQEQRNLGKKYNKALQEAVRYMLRLHTLSDTELNDQLPDYARHPVLVKSRANPDNITLLEKILLELE